MSVELYLENKEYLVFCEFLLRYESVIVYALEGKLQNVVMMYNQYLKSLHCTNYPVNIIEQYISEFNNISDNSIDIELGTWDKIITHIDVEKLYIVKGKLLDTESEDIVETKKLNTNLDNLFDILDSHQDNYTKLCKLINYIPASVKLAKVRAKLSIRNEPFFDVCQNSTHSRVLTNVCLSRNEMASLNPKQIYPSLEQCHASIENNCNLFSPEIYQCSQVKIHYLPIITNHTDINSGDCSYLDTCHKMKSCKYLHYFSLLPNDKKFESNQFESIDKGNEVAIINEQLYNQDYTLGFCYSQFFRKVNPPQWIKCDVRKLPFSILGKFAAIISDPAWDIHMSLPYGTCSDVELMELPMHELQDEGIMLLWVTGRSIEIGRKALKKWGYKISDELIWIKLNQLRRTIVTGRTGHWLNHSKEHLLVGLKGNPTWINKMIDINTIVSTTRETSRKPDEAYDLVERIVGTHARKLEIFGRDHNIRPGWTTIGNQVSGTSIVEQEVLNKYNDFKAKH